jgi:hypothetical protein
MRGIGYSIIAVITLTTALSYISLAPARANSTATPVLGGKLPAGYRDWKLISVAHEAGKLNDLRAVLGN